MEKRIYYLDILRVIAVIAVVCNHCWGYHSVDNYNVYNGTFIFFIDILLNSFTRFNVPVFLMISGYLMLRQQKYEDINVCLKKVFSIIRLLVIWVVIYTLGNCIIAGNINFFNIIKTFLLAAFGGGEMGHLWYLYTTLGLYLISPFLAVVFRKNASFVNYFLVLWFIWSVFIQGIAHYIPRLTSNKYIDLNLLGGYAGWYVLGYKLGNLENKLNRKIYIIIFLSSGLFTSASVIISQYFCGKDTYMQDFFSPTVICMSVSLFIYFKCYGESFILKRRVEIWSKKLAYMSKISFGIYLVHFMITDIVQKIYVSYINPRYGYLIIMPVIVLVSSYSLAKVISDNKILNKLLFTI